MNIIICYVSGVWQQRSVEVTKIINFTDDNQNIER